MTDQRRRFSKADGRFKLSKPIKPKEAEPPLKHRMKVFEGNLDEAMFGKKKKIINPKVPKDE